VSEDHKSTECLNDGFPISEEQEFIIKKKQANMRRNISLLHDFDGWLKTHFIKLIILSFNDISIIFRMFLKDNRGIMINNHESICRKDIISRTLNSNKILKYDNWKLLDQFILWLDKYAIDLTIISFKEAGILMRMFIKQYRGIKRTQTERDCLKDIMNREIELSQF
jgi:hypothetical protein